MTPMASVFTPSYNKGAYAADAIRSILAQDYGDFEYWILENSTDDGATRDQIAPLLDDPRVIYQEFDIHPEWREKVYIPAWLLNQWYPRANGKYIFYLSDDDLLDPATIGTCVRFLEEDPGRHVCWFSMRRVAAPRPGPVAGDLDGGFPADKPMGHDTPRHHVDCRIDGGQVAHRRTCLDGLQQPWFPEDSDGGAASHADGLFLQKLASRYTFWPIPEHLLTKRLTPLSAWTQC